MNGIKPGDTCTVKRDIFIDGKVAFAEGEQALIERVDPNPQMPQFRYVVMSNRLGQRFQLSDESLELQTYVAPGDAFRQNVATGPKAPGVPPHTPSQAYATRRGTTTQAITTISIMFCGLLIIISTFLPWVSVLIFSASGWRTITDGGLSGSSNFLFVSGGGLLYFTGFWSLLMGLIIILGAVLFILKGITGVRIAQIAGGVGAVIALISIMSMFTHAGINAGSGLWLFLLFSICVCIAGEIGARSLT